MARGTKYCGNIGKAITECYYTYEWRGTVTADFSPARVRRLPIARTRARASVLQRGFGGINSAGLREDGEPRLLGIRRAGVA